MRRSAWIYWQIQIGTPQSVMAEMLGLSRGRVWQLCRKVKRAVARTKHQIHPRAYKARPIILEGESLRGEWIEQDI